MWVAIVVIIVVLVLMGAGLFYMTWQRRQPHTPQDPPLPGEEPPTPVP